MAAHSGQSRKRQAAISALLVSPTGQKSYLMAKAGSRYKFAIASTYEAFCPTLRDKLGAQSKVPDGVGSIMEIIMNGHDLATIARATQAAIAAAIDTPGLVKISAGNYGGRLGKSFIYLHPKPEK